MSAKPPASIFLLAPLIFGLACATPVSQRPWVVVSSPNFEIFSTMPESEVLDLARELERFRALIHTVTSAAKSESPVPTKITAFARRSEFARFTASRRAAGYFQAGMRSNQVVLADWSNRMDAARIILHEYVHFVLGNGTSIQYPVWYDEGFAEFLSTARTFEDKIAVGAFPEARVQSFRFGQWVPLRRIIEARTYGDLPRADRHMLYAEAWALVHYLSLGRGDRLSMSADLASYLHLLELGLGPSAAFEQAFGESPDEVEDEIIRKLREGDWRVVGVPLELLEYDRTPPRSRVPARDEVAVRLGQVLLARGDDAAAAAQRQFELALAANPGNARAEAGLGDALKFQEQWEEAEPHFRRALELASADPLNELDLAEYLHDRALKEASGEDRRRLLVEARAAYRRSLALDGSIPETWAMLGRTHLAAGEDPVGSLEPIERAFRMLPSQPVIVESLAEAYLVNDRENEARAVLRRSAVALESGSLDQSVDQWIEAIRDRRAEEAEALAERESGEDA